MGLFANHFGRNRLNATLHGIQFVHHSSKFRFSLISQNVPHKNHQIVTSINENTNGIVYFFHGALHQFSENCLNAANECIWCCNQILLKGLSEIAPHLHWNKTHEIECCQHNLQMRISQPEIAFGAIGIFLLAFFAPAFCCTFSFTWFQSAWILNEFSRSFREQNWEKVNRCAFLAIIFHVFLLSLDFFPFFSLNC